VKAGPVRVQHSRTKPGKGRAGRPARVPGHISRVLPGSAPARGKRTESRKERRGNPENRPP